MIKIGIVGFGRMGMSHYAIANAHPEAEVTAVCEPSSFIRNALEKHTSVKCYKNYDDMLKSSQLDALFITTPTRLHYGMTRDAIESGLHVFVEKPFCLTPAEGLDLVELAEKKRIVNQVGYHNRFLGTFREAKRLLQNNAIGEVYHILGEVYGPVVLKGSKKTWRAESSKGGGCLYDYATHLVNLMQFLNGPPDRVTDAVMQSIYSQGVEDAVFSTIRFDDGASGQIRANWSEETYRKLFIQITIFGKLGKIRSDAQEMSVYFRNEPLDSSYEKGWNMRWVTDLSPEIDFYLRGEEYSAQVDYFIDAVIKNNLHNINSFYESQITDQTISAIKTAGERV
jgi:predicted dehydrogenase